MGAWVVIFLAGTVATVWNVFYVLDDFFKYDVDTSISINKKTTVRR